MIGFVGTPPFLRIAFWVVIISGSYAFSHSPNRFIFEEHFLCIKGVSVNTLAPMKYCPRGASLAR